MLIISFRIPTGYGIQEVSPHSVFFGALWAAIFLVGSILASVMVLDHIMRDAAIQIPRRWPMLTTLLSRLMKRSFETILLFTGFGIKLNHTRFSPSLKTHLTRAQHEYTMT